MSEDCIYFDKNIRIHQQNITASQRQFKITLAVGVALALFALAAWAAALLFKLIELALVPLLVPLVGTAAGALVSAFSLLPHKEITPNRLKIAKFERLKMECEKIKDLPEEEQRARLKEINDFLKDM